MLTPARDEAGIRAYYDEFSRTYEDARHAGYHALIDDLAIDFASRFVHGGEVLEVGCGTGLLLERLAGLAQRAVGVDLSPGMLEKARERGLEVHEASVTALPFADASFDVTCAFKVLPHVPDLGAALSEMARVTRPGGILLVELYNPLSLRGLVKRLGPAGRIGERTRESAVFTRFDPPWKLEGILPPGCEILDSRGVRILTPVAGALKLPVLGELLERAERRLCDSRLSVFGGFWIAAVAKRG